MNWDDLRLFLAVARSGSVSGAARQLGVQHSTVSRRLRQLEGSLGSRLVERQRGGYRLTPVGEELRDSAVRVEQEVLGLDGVLARGDAALSGPLRVTAINNMACSVLMPIFAAFSERHPGVELQVQVSNSDASLAQREADVAIRLTNTPTETLVGRRVATVASAVYGGRDYLSRLRRQAARPEWIGVECCGFHRSWTRAACEVPQHRFTSDDTLLTQAAIRAGLGLSYLPCFMGDADPLLARYAEPDPTHHLGLWILFHPDLKRTARVLAFRDHFSREIAARQALLDGSAGAQRRSQ